MKRRHVLLVLGLTSAAAIAALGDRTPSNPLVDDAKQSRPTSSARSVSVDRSDSTSNANSTASANAPAVVAASRASPSKSVTILALTPRTETTGSQIGDGAASVFTSQTWVPPPPPPASPPSPSAPALPFSYLGKQQDNGVWTVFLSREGTTVIAQAGERIDSSYQVISIAPPTLVMKYLPLNETQTLTIE